MKKFLEFLKKFLEEIQEFFRQEPCQDYPLTGLMRWKSVGNPGYFVVCEPAEQSATSEASFPPHGKPTAA